ncbi:amino acid ABC transporter permease [Magnetovibrio blakemorei]|uniref:Amino acid ABC transporter permease n=1 Tax=Magnetovibrio blakemorei TaxID=28181 RepID=A0A1E5QAL1_9PROT|nr:amino acid ABC transporter permease [Magnetovibrio blakemorei]OEJ69025.1 amino acid ABC transporter permease [Magnetovibrio blakemorei]
MNEFKPLPSLPPPASLTGVVGWLHKNLFSTPLYTILTLVVGYLVISSLIPVLDWAIFSANFTGNDRSACESGTGACWAFIGNRINIFAYGSYPAAEYWRLDICFALLVLSFGPQFFDKFPYKMWLGVFSLTGFPVICFYLISGGAFGLESIETGKWGGLALTLMLAYVGIVAALPFGIVLALGRRSEMPVIRTFCIAFIELWRGVPLISVLFMSSVMLPLFLPEGMNFDKLLRALIGITMFQSAYMAEVIRGGLQAIPRGQYEASKALGLSYWKSMGLIILPQALKLVIPGIVNTFIALFKDTTLVLIIGLLDILATVQASITDPEWGSVATEGYVFAALCFWVFCFGMSRYSQSLERKLHTGHKR